MVPIDVLTWYHGTLTCVTVLSSGNSSINIYHEPNISHIIMAEESWRHFEWLEAPSMPGSCITLLLDSVGNYKEASSYANMTRTRVQIVLALTRISPEELQFVERHTNNIDVYIVIDNGKTARGNSSTVFGRKCTIFTASNAVYKKFVSCRCYSCCSCLTLALH